jgi:hypothetical protein
MSDAREFTGIEEGFTPYSHLDFKNDPDEFQFAIIVDNAGGSRPGVFSAAMDMVNLMQPEFVACLGDLIEGYADDEDVYRQWWEEIDENVAKLEMPFFFLAGNHDLNTQTSQAALEERLGSDRTYYHFVYKNVLFLMLSTEDPPKDPADLGKLSPEKYSAIAEGYAAVNRLKESDEPLTPDRLAQALELIEPVEAWAGEINISDEQVAYFKQVIEENPDVRWTFCLVHSPAWLGDKDPGNFPQIEALLQDRPYTFFAAHTHTYDYTERNGRDYVTGACTGALQFPRAGAIDHFFWVTMTDEGPKIANVLLNGVCDKHGPPDSMIDYGLYRPQD